GREITKHTDYSELTAQEIDSEVKLIVDTAMHRAEQILVDNLDVLHRLSKELLEREILDAEEIKKIMRGEALPPMRKNNNGEISTADSDKIPDHVKEMLQQRESKNTQTKEDDSDDSNS
ncbi:Cell division protein FtsH, partial [hydrothermal vent metagenome]